FSIDMAQWKRLDDHLPPVQRARTANMTLDSGAVINIAWAPQENHLLQFRHGAREFSRQFRVGAQQPPVLEVSSDQSHVAAVTGMGVITVFAVKGDDLESQSVIDGQQEPVISMQFSSDGKRLHAMTGDYGYHVWAWEGDPDIVKTPAHQVTARSVIFDRDGSYALTTGYDHHVKLWDVNRHEQRLDV